MGLQDLLIGFFFKVFAYSVKNVTHSARWNVQDFAKLFYFDNKVKQTCNGLFDQFLTKSYTVVYRS